MTNEQSTAKSHLQFQLNFEFQNCIYIQCTYPLALGLDYVSNFNSDAQNYR